MQNQRIPTPFIFIKTARFSFILKGKRAFSLLFRIIFYSLIPTPFILFDL